MHADSPRRIAFYPCCGNDLVKPLRLLAGDVDYMFFCDRFDFGAKERPKSSGGSSPRLPTFEFLVGAWREKVKDIGPFDLLFYRRDSEGEGGSGDSALSKNALSLLQDCMSASSWIVTDGIYDPDRIIEKVRRHGVAGCGARVLALQPDEQLEKQGLMRICFDKN